MDAIGENVVFSKPFLDPVLKIAVFDPPSDHTSKSANY
jgi:hypothetical protein